MRSRNIKPGFYQNEDLACLPYETRLLFPGLWMMADREGRLEDRPLRIKMQIFPADSVDVDEMLDRLQEKGFILRYLAEGHRYIQINAFLKHQTPHYSEKPSIIPSPSQNGTGELQEGSQNIPGELQEGSCHRNPLIPDSLIPDSLIPDSLIPNATLPTVRVASAPDLESEPPLTISKQDCQHKKIIELYHIELPELPSVKVWNETNKKHLKARWSEDPKRQQIEWWITYFRMVKSCPFLIGQNDKGWVADLEWLVRPTNMSKVLNGRYQLRNPPQTDERLSKRGQATLRNIQALREREKANAGQGTV